MRSFFNSNKRPIHAGIWAICLVFCISSAFAFDLQGHRGARGLAPENTLPAFERALVIGVTTLELDIGITLDGVAVVSHDPYLNADITRDAAGQWLATRGPLIASLTLAQLQTYELGRINPASAYAKQFPQQQGQDGVRMPTLAALFARVKALGATDVRFNIETKLNPTRPDDTPAPEAFVRILLQTIADAGMGQRVTIQSFDWRTLQLVQRSAPSIPTVYLTVQASSFDNLKDGAWTAGFKLADHASVPALVKAAGGKVWSPNAGSITPEAVREAQALGLQVIPWTVNQRADLARLLDWKVDGVITDYPDLLRELMRERGMALPMQISIPTPKTP